MSIDKNRPLIYLLFFLVYPAVSHAGIEWPEQITGIKFHLQNDFATTFVIVAISLGILFILMKTFPKFFPSAAGIILSLIATGIAATIISEFGYATPAWLLIVIFIIITKLQNTWF